MRTQPYERDYALCGQDVVTGTASQTSSVSAGGWYEMEVIADAVVANMTWADGYNATGDWSDLTSIPAGMRLEGLFSQIQLTSGEVILKRNSAP